MKSIPPNGNARSEGFCMIPYFLHTVHRFINSLFCRNQRYMEEYADIRSYSRATAVNILYYRIDS